MLAIEPEHDTARNQLLSYAVQENDTAAIKQVCLPAVAYSAADPLYYYYLGIVYFQQKQYEEAVQTLSKGLERVKEDTPIDLISNSYTLLGDLYHDLGDDEKAYAAYDSCLIYNPEDVGALNNYAYYLSLNNHDLARAEEMSAKTIKAEPDNYTYIDTYAWILFMQKRYDEAKMQIDRALEVMGDTIEAEDSNIVEHAGDIYFKAGDKEGALRLWIKAEQLGNTEAPDTLRRKIKTKKYIKK
jgi:tetratricopeptide (TPR) repeat protein